MIVFVILMVLGTKCSSARKLVSGFIFCGVIWIVYISFVDIILAVFVQFKYVLMLCENVR